MHNLPATLNTNSRACSVLSSNNPRSHCSVCNKQTLAQSQAQLNETTDNTEDHLPLEQREKTPTGYKDSRLPNVSSKEDSQNQEQDANAALKCTKKEQDSRIDLQEEFHKHTNCDEMLDKMKTIQDYLDEESENSKDFLLPEKILQNKVLLMGKHAGGDCSQQNISGLFSRFFLLDIVEKKCNHSCCFTKG